MINWHKYFDHIYCISNIGTNRYNTIKNELNRIGILDSGIFSWKITTNKFLSHINYDLKSDIEYIDNDKLMKNKSMDLVKNYLDIFEEVKLLKYNHILIIEDDAHFLKDINKIEEILDNLPDYYDICHFDYAFLTYFEYIYNANDADKENFYNIFEYNKINDFYSFTLGTFLTTCCAYSYKTVCELISNINESFNNENMCRAIDHYIKNCNIIKENNTHKYTYFADKYMYQTNILNDKNSLNEILSIPRLCVQDIADNSLNVELSMDFNYIYYDNEIDKCVYEKYNEYKLEKGLYNI